MVPKRLRCIARLGTPDCQFEQSFHFGEGESELLGSLDESDDPYGVVAVGAVAGRESRRRFQ